MRSRLPPLFTLGSRINCLHDSFDEVDLLFFDGAGLRDLGLKDKIGVLRYLPA